MEPSYLPLTSIHLQNEAKFDLFYDRVCQDCKNFTEKPQLPQQRKRPRRLEDGADTYHYQDPKQRYRCAYFEMLELAAGELDRRFDQSDLYTIKEL